MASGEIPVKLSMFKDWKIKKSNIKQIMDYYKKMRSVFKVKILKSDNIEKKEMDLPHVNLQKYPSAESKSIIDIQSGNPIVTIGKKIIKQNE